ncbi:MAG: pyridoxal-phosphate dependent enzyme [Gemmatimonadota bacterium]|nr:pyridoxal-phosphate dependent enzyme [Gemmatimonadota bacterium]
MSGAVRARKGAPEGLRAPTLEEIEGARVRIAGAAIRSPLVRLETEEGPRLWLKLENLQPIGSFKLRGAASAIGLLDDTELAEGVWTASAGNMAQGVAWAARRLGVPCAVVVPETAPAAKLEAIARLGARAVKTSVESWFEVFSTRRFEGMEGRFIHAFMDRDVMAGNGTIALEILEDLPDVDSIVVPFGGGGLACGIAAGLEALAPEATVFAAEVEGQAPLAASLEADRAVSVDSRPTFVDGIGGPHVEPPMWELARRMRAGSIVVSLEEVAAAVRLLVERARTDAEGAGAASVAAALSKAVPGDDIVCVVSGGNLDRGTLAGILAGEIP